MVTPKLRGKPVMRAWRDWKTLLRTARPVGGIAVLDRRHVYILPTRQGVLFALVLSGMLVASINYSLSLGFVLTFLLGGLCVVAMLHTWRNLANLAISAGRTPPVFAGEEARFGLLAADRSGRSRHAIGLRHDRVEAAFADIPAAGRAGVALPLRTSRRGWLAPGRVTVFTEFPLGLFRAWSYVELDHRCLVYPHPASSGRPPSLSGSNDQAGKASTDMGGDDFSGLRAYQQGDPPRRIDWKASAREQVLLTKQFQGATSAMPWLDWRFTSDRDTETRISQLTRWVLDAQAGGQSYGLRLPDQEIAPASGESHFRMCLEALALFGAPR